MSQAPGDMPSSSMRIVRISLSLLAALGAFVVTQTAHAQVVYVEVQPPVVVYQPPPPPTQFRPAAIQSAPTAQRREMHWGVHGELGAIVYGQIAMGGGSLAFRIRPIRWLAIDLGMGNYRGVGFHGEARSEIPMTASALVFVNPRDRLQLYMLGGAGVSFAVVDTRWRDPPGTRYIDFTTEFYVYFGGQLGVGLEWRVGRHFAINSDLRAFIRSRVDDSTIPDFTNAATGASTNTSGGIYWTAGATAYW